jgi:DNA-binding IclR family transcriptional regulator
MTRDEKRKPAIARRGRPQRLNPDQAGNMTVLIGLNLLKGLASAGKPLGLTEIGRMTNMSPSRTHRYLASLTEAGFVRKDEESGRYDIGAATAELGFAAIRRVDSTQVTQIMEDLTRETGLVSYICIWGSNGPTVIRREMGQVQTAVRIQEGSNLSLLTATGQIFLAHLPEAQTRNLLQRDISEWNAIAKGPPAKIGPILKGRDRVRAAGLARTVGMRNPTWTAFSAPVFSRDGRFRMALTVIGVSRLFDTRVDGTVAQKLKDAARRLTAATINS